VSATSYHPGARSPSCRDGPAHPIWVKSRRVAMPPEPS
jgi:hypothetical protein